MVGDLTELGCAVQAPLILPHTSPSFMPFPPHWPGVSRHDGATAHGGSHDDNLEDGFPPSPCHHSSFVEEESRVTRSESRRPTVPGFLRSHTPVDCCSLFTCFSPDPAHQRIQNCTQARDKTEYQQFDPETVEPTMT